jgi:acetyl-CoA carboxylase biotin carboxyl carrier protein
MALTEDEVLQILKLIEESHFSEFHLEMGDLKLTVKKGERRGIPSEEIKPISAEIPVAARRQEPLRKQEMQPIEAPDNHLFPVKSPMLGMFYRAPSPGAPPYVEVGSQVREDDTICLIEVMKVFNAVKAGTSGTIEKVCAETGQLVEYGQPLFFIRGPEYIQERKKEST